VPVGVDVVLGWVSATRMAQPTALAPNIIAVSISQRPRKVVA
jgi:hypothetical protein